MQSSQLLLFWLYWGLKSMFFTIDWDSNHLAIHFNLKRTLMPTYTRVWGTVRLKGGVPVSYSGCCLYNNSPLYRNRANDSQGMCTVCTLNAVPVETTNMVDIGGHLYTFFLFLPDISLMKQMIIYLTSVPYVSVY